MKFALEKGLYESVSLVHTEGWDVRMGRQFETLVLNNFKALLPYLGLSKSASLYAPIWRRGGGILANYKMI